MDNIKSKEKLKEHLSIAEAIENLTTLLEMEIDEKTPIGMLQNKKLTTREEDFTYKEIEWLFPEVPENFIDAIRPTYRVVLEYLREVYNNPETNWEDEKTILGLRSIMSLSEDAAGKIKDYFALFNKNVDFRETVEFKELESFFRDYILKKLPEIEGKEAWEKEWPKDKEAVILETESALKDFDSIGKDLDYELFYIRNEDEVPFLSSELVRNLKLHVRLEEEKKSGEDPFADIRKIEEKDIQRSARQILNSLEKEIHEFYKFQFDCVKNKLSGCLNKAFMALMLAANPNNLLKRKPCSRYFKDFQVFLRRCFYTEDYRKIVTKTEEIKGSDAFFLASVVNKLSFNFFMRLGGVKEEVVAFILKFMHEGAEKESAPKGSFWNFLEKGDDDMHLFLKGSINSSLLKIAEVLRIEEQKIMAFDPILQGNIPEKLYEVGLFKNKASILHLACPTKQEIITKAVVVEEFYGFLRQLKKEKGKHLFFNLQDRLSWRENARSMAIEQVAQNPEFQNVFEVVTLAKDSNFYHQKGDYYALTNAFQFVVEFKKALLNNEEGFFISPKIKEKMTSFIENALIKVHEHFFFGKEDLSRQERLDFIEIFYHFFILKAIEVVEPYSISFSSKDAIDTGSVESASFYAFVKMLHSANLTKEDKDYMLWLLYSPAFLIRERPVNSERLIRGLSAMALLEGHKANIGQKFSELFDKSFLNSFELFPKE